MATFNDKPSFNYPLAAENKWADYLWSLLKRAVENNIAQWTLFADPRQQQIARELLQHFSALKCSFFGGYPEAERVRICFSPFAVPEFPGNIVSCFSIEGSFPEGILTHRDFLGAVLGLGIKREAVGDIIYRGGKEAFLLTTAEMKPFVLSSLNTVGRFTVRVAEVPLEEFGDHLGPPRRKEIKGTVASMRLDAVAGLGFGLSRSRIAPLIKGGQVKVNYQIVNRPSGTVRAGDLISLAGKGRIEVVDTMGETRKGRTHLLLHRII